MEAYIYTYVNKETGKTYIGSRSAYKGSCYDDFNIKYFSSSKNKEFRQDMTNGKLEGQIVLVMNDENANKKIVEVESKMITAYWEKYGKENSYNHHNNNGSFSTAGKEPWNKGVARTKDVKEKISIANSNPSDETRKKKSDSWKYDKHFTEETRKKISDSLIGRVLSDEWKEKIRNSHLGLSKMKYKFLTQDGTTKEMSLQMAKRWHPDWVLITE